MPAGPRPCPGTTRLPQKAAISRYLRILVGWKLTPDQWEKLADRAVMRLTRRFPMPGKLYEIAAELSQEAELRANSKHLDQMRAEWGQRGDAGVKCDLGMPDEAGRPRHLASLPRALIPDRLEGPAGRRSRRARLPSAHPDYGPDAWETTGCECLSRKRDLRR